MAYTVPSAADLKTRHPRFVSVADGTVLAYINEATRTISTDWSEADYADGIMYLAAHFMVMEGAIDPTQVAPGIGNQIKKVSAEGIVEFDTTGAVSQTGGQLWANYGRTIYGQRYLELSARNVGQGEAAVLIV